MGRRDLIDTITIDDLAAEYKEVAEVIGFETYKKLVKEFGGANMYVPKATSLTKTTRDECIKGEFNGGNYKRLAMKYNLSESTIRAIIKGVS